MTRRGRKPTGPQLVERLEGSSHAKIRLRIILETLAGQRTIPDACAELGIQESMFHKLRSAVLQTALGRLEPRPLGRRPQYTSPEDEHAAELEDEVEHLRMELQAAQIRQELAEKLPRLTRLAPGPGKKTPLPNCRAKKQHRNLRDKKASR
jgi:transposase-like protein